MENAFLKYTQEDVKLLFSCGSAESAAAVPEVSLAELYHGLPNLSLQGERHFRRVLLLDLQPDADISSSAVQGWI